MNETLKVAIASFPAVGPSFWAIAAGLLTPLLAVIAAYIAYQQYRVNKDRLRYELYDKRAAVFAALDLFLSDFIRDGHTTFERTNEYYREVILSRFLFQKTIQDYLEEIYRHGIECYELHLKLYPAGGEPGPSRGPERSAIATQQHEIQTWMIKQRQEAIEKFRDYFQFRSNVSA